ncbi:hypothetical protein RHGRI_018963 [Rhododendron griersonianum]|uniref:Uncharacterized protein n=1 Tax=Rhododendron griersonianum TaxID=479676 RepID=A0AAV6JE55_9ERIC|nr:hypothetical protein RHGRI_018963 [Rhododendron griersonianum]
MAVMEKLKMFVVQEPVVTASCLIAGFGTFLHPFPQRPFPSLSFPSPFHLTVSFVVNISGLFLPAVVRPILDSFENSKQVQPPALNDVSIKVS